MSDIRGYSTIAERIDPSALAAQLNRHRAEMNRAILAACGTVMQYVGDAVMAVFGAPTPSEDHADRALTAALAMHAAQSDGQRRVGAGGAASLRPRHRPVHRGSGRRPARVGGAVGVHGGG